MKTNMAQQIAEKWQKIAESSEAQALLKLALHIDDICDHDGDVTEFLPTLLHQLAQLLDVQTVAVTINDADKKQRILQRYDRGTCSLSEENILKYAISCIHKKDWLNVLEPEPDINNLLALPIIKADRTLGVFVLVNKSNGNFTEYDKIVVMLVEAQMDNVIDSWLKKQEQRVISIENRVMKKLDKIRDESQDQGEALDEMIDTLISSVDAQIGFITLYDSEKDHHVPGGRVLRGNRPMSQKDYKLVGDLVREAKDNHKTISKGRIEDSEIDSILVIPMFMSGLYLGSVVLINKLDSEKFSDQDQQLIESVTHIIDSFIYHEEKVKRLMQLVGREATRDVEEALMTRRPDTGHGKRMVVTMFFADIRNYSKMTKDMDPTTAVRMLNDYFNAITPIINSYNGIVDKYVGDELVAIFSQSTHKGPHQLLAVEAAIKMQGDLQRFNREWELTGRPIIETGIGIHTGEVVVGQIGSFDRKDYTAIGSNMNFAARLQAVAGPGEIIISEQTYIGLTGKIMARRVGPFQIKGFDQQTAYLVEGKSPDTF